MHWKQFCRYFYVRGNLDTEKLVHPKLITHLPTSSGRRVDGICQKLIGGGSQKSWPTHWSSFLKFHVIGPYVVFSTPPPLPPPSFPHTAHYALFLLRFSLPPSLSLSLAALWALRWCPGATTTPLLLLSPSIAHTSLTPSSLVLPRPLTRWVKSLAPGIAIMCDRRFLL
jgi:hypothetical protein